ncbi:MAG: sulfatase, partial [Limisphaerales bacterium]
MKHTLIILTACLTALCCAVSGVAHAADATRKPNIIVILADDLGYSDLGCFGSKKIKTPNLDRMATEGLKLTSFYAQPICGPSRAALMSGCYPMRVAEPGNRKGQHNALHPQEVTMAEVLKGAGYATACIGKWHLGAGASAGAGAPAGGAGVWNAATMPNAQGFDYFYGTPSFNGVTPTVEGHPVRAEIRRNTEVVVQTVTNWDHITQDYTREALQFIRANRERPFFLYLAHNMPHIPLGASEKFKGKSAGGPFGNAVEEIDWSCGEILKALKELGLDERTLVLFTSDNGPWIETTEGMKPDGKPFIPRDHSGNADPLRGYKMVTWDGGFRVPCLVRWPGTIPAGSASDELTSTLDLLPTFAALAGTRPPADRTLDGLD